MGMMRTFAPVAALSAACAALWFAPGPRTLVADNHETVTARVVEVDDSGLALHGFLEYGTQRLKVDLGERGVFAAENEIRAQMDLDKKFKVGDVALVVLPNGYGPNTILIARDHWRLGWMMTLFGGFCVLLTVFGGWTGAKALFSFVFSCLAVWKLLIPLCLRGWPASVVSFLTVAVLTAVIMYLVAGWTRKGASAFLGAMLGVIVSFGLAHFFGRVMNVNGATMPFSQALLYSGCESLDLQDLFVGAIVLASSGAVMDLAMDISAGVAEVAYHKPSLSSGALFLSGLRMGRAVVGTMTTTLLLAYSGGYLTLLMVFAVQGTSPVDFLNTTLVSAEIVKTLVGSFGLVLVAPFTALTSSILFRGRKN